MPKQPVRAVDDRTVQLHVTLPGWLKNAVLDAAVDADVSINTWVTHALSRQLECGDDVRPPVRVMPSSGEVIADYLAGRVTLAPCGVRFPCEGAGVVRLEAHGLLFCGVCRIRV